MPRTPDTCRIDLAEIFLHVQRQMLAHLAVGELLEHAGASGAATEHHWIDLFNRYLPQRYHASSAFIVDSAGHRSRQIDIAIYDRFYSPLFFPHETGLHIPAESVFAVFEVKQTLTRQLIRDAGIKAASVRRLRRTSATVPFAGGRYPPKQPHPILAGVLGLNSVWRGTFEQRLSAVLRSLAPAERLDLGCVLSLGAFEHTQSLRFSTAEESLIFFVIRLLERLRGIGNAPAVDLMAYGRGLASFRKGGKKRPGVMLDVTDNSDYDGQ